VTASNVQANFVPTGQYDQLPVHPHL
jgi:hypothetical protein